jgi:hypothetical protein
MSDRDDFLAWGNTALYEAELALRNGDAAPLAPGPSGASFSAASVASHSSSC